MKPLVLPFPPGKNQMWRSVVVYVRGRPAARVLLSREARAYFAAVAKQLKAAGVLPMQGPLSVQVDVYRPRKAGDLDGRLPAVLDALNGHAWNDDAQVVRLVATRHDDKANPRVEVAISAAPAALLEVQMDATARAVAKPRRLSGPTMAALATSASLRPIARPVCAGCRSREHEKPWDRDCVCPCHNADKEP